MVMRIGPAGVPVPVTQQPTQVDQPIGPVDVPLSRPSARNLANLSGESNGSFPSLPAVGRQTPLSRVSETARADAADRVEGASREYRAAREDVNRLNAGLEQALREEPSLRDPASAERYRTAFMETHRDSFERERTTARALADTVRAAEPALRTSAIDPNDAQGMLDRITVAQGLDTLAQSSEYRQAATIAGQFRGGTNPPLPPAVADGIADRAAITGVREDLANGRSVTDSMTRASSLLGAAGFVSRVPALSSLGNALAVGENVSEFVRTGDPARIGAAGFAALGAGGAAYAAIVGGGPVTIGVAAAAFTGKAICEYVAGRNDYRRDTDPAFERAFGTSRETIERYGREAADQAHAELQLRPIERDAIGRIDILAGRRFMDARTAELLAARMATLR